MSPSRKSDPTHRSRRPRAAEPSPAPLAVLTSEPAGSEPPAAPLADNPWGAAAVRIPYGDGFLLAAPGTDPAPLIEALDEYRLPREWARLGAKLLALGSHRVRLAMHVARAAAGGRGLPPAEEERLVEWFVALVEEGIVLTGGAQPRESGIGQENPVTSALWHLAISDCVPDHERGVRIPVDPAITDASFPGPTGSVAEIVRAAGSYLRTVIAGASACQLVNLKLLVDATDEDLQEYRPWGTPHVEDRHVAEREERALSLLGMRRPTHAQLCNLVEEWASAYRQTAHEHPIPPVHRIGAVVWLVREIRRLRGA